jgi:hypothetical protein
MKLKFAVHQNKIYQVEMNVIAGKINYKNVEPDTKLIPSYQFDRSKIFNTKIEAKNFLKNEQRVDIPIS